MILLEFECSTEVLNKIIESESGLFRKSSETIESLSLKFFSSCQKFCTETFTSSQQYFLSYASSSIDKAIRTTNNDPLNIIEFRDSDSMLDKRIMEDWLVKNKDRLGLSPHFICVLSDDIDPERAIEPILQSTNMLRGSAYVSKRVDDEVMVSVMEYPAYRLDGSVIGGIEFNYKLSRLNSNLASQLKLLSFFEGISAPPAAKKVSPAELPLSTERKESSASNNSSNVDVVIDSASVNVVQGIKELRQILGLGLKEAKDLFESLPSATERNIDEARANRLRDDLIAAGFSVTLKDAGSSSNSGRNGGSSQSIDANGLTVLSCDLEVFAFRNELENQSETDVARETIRAVGLEIENSLSATEPPCLIVYRDGGISLIPYEEISESDIANSINAGVVNLVVRELSGHDWESALVYMSGDANARILAVGYHPSFEQPVRQIYDCGELDTGIVEDRDLDLYGSEDVASMFNEMLRA